MPNKSIAQLRQELPETKDQLTAELLTRFPAIDSRTAIELSSWIKERYEAPHTEDTQN